MSYSGINGKVMPTDAQMIYYTEEVLEGTNDPAVRAMVDLWHRLCAEVLGRDLALGVTFRHEIPAFHDPHYAELNTAHPVTSGDINLMCLVFNHDPVEEILITHEIGHCVLKLQGFKGLRFKPGPNTAVEVAFNSMATHPALYALQRSIGHEPQGEIDSHADHDIGLFENRGLLAAPDKLIELACIAADDLLNASREKVQSLNRALERGYPGVKDLVDRILEAARVYDPSQLATHGRFVRHVRQTCGLTNQWEISQEIDWLKRFARGEVRA